MCPCNLTFENDNRLCCCCFLLLLLFFLFIFFFTWTAVSRVMSVFPGKFLDDGPRGPEAQRPGCPAAQRPGGPAVNPHACTDPHLVWSCKMDDGEFEFVYHFNDHFNPFRLFLSLHVAKWKNVVILCLFVCIQNPIERKSILKRCKLFSNHSLKNSALLSFWGGVPVNRPTCLCIEKDSQFIYLISYDIFTFKVWFENNLHRSIMKVLYCAIGFCKETN